MRLFVLLLVAVGACGAPPASDEAAVRAEVAALLEAIPTDLAARGPTAWLDHFEHSDVFFMGSDGAAVFPSYAVADSFVRGFAPAITGMSLRWIDPRIDVHSPDIVSIGSAYEESLTDTSGTVTSFGGYFTATAVRGADGWVLRNLHWSSPAQGPQ